MKNNRSVMVILLGLIGLSGIPSELHAEPDVACSVTPLQGGPGADLGGRFEYRVTRALGAEPFSVESELLVLDRDANILETIRVDDAARLQLAIRDRVLVQSLPGPPKKWLVHAPGLLFRVRIVEQYQSRVAYCSPYSAIRLDQPENLVFVSNVVTPRAPIHLVVAFTQMVPESIQVLLDGIDILRSVNATIPGGPFSGSAQIAGVQATIENLVADPDRGTISFSVLDLPGGGHRVRVSGTPTYAGDLPPGSPRWNRPLGALLNRQTIAVFRAELTNPSDGDALPRAPLQVRGRITHGLEIADLRVHGADIALPPVTLIPGDEFIGDTYTVDFATTVPLSELDRDFFFGDDVLSSLDPGVNYLSVLSSDNLGNVAGDRVRFSLGAVEGVPNPLEAANTECPDPPGTADFVPAGFVAAVSEAALTEAARFRVLPLIASKVATSLETTIGQQRTVTGDYCPEQVALTAPRGTFVSAPPRPDPPERAAFNSPPFLSGIGDQDVDMAEFLHLFLVASDLNNDPLTFSMHGNIPPDALLTPIDDTRAEFAWAAGCDQLGASYDVTFQVSDGTEVDEETIRITVRAAETTFTDEFEFTSIQYDINQMDTTVELTSDDTVRFTYNTGPLTLGVHGGKCLLDCFFFCCLDYSADVEVQIDESTTTLDLTRSQALYGVGDTTLGSTLVIEEKDINIIFLEVDFGGPLTWAVFLEDLLLDIFEVPDFLAELFFEDFVEDEVRDEFNTLVQGELAGGELFALPALKFSEELDPDVPLELCAVDARSARIVPAAEDSAGSFSIPLNSRFAATTGTDTPPPWVPTPSDFADAVELGADLVFEVSDDALNQMMAEVTATGTLRGSYQGFTLGDFSSNLSADVLAYLALLGLGADTPIFITVDTAQDSAGNSIPPMVAFIDNGADDGKIEMAVRTQLLVRGIFEKGLTVGDDRDICSCTDPRPSCLGQPCLVFEDVLKLNFLLDTFLVGDPPTLTQLDFVVTEVQQLTRGEGFSSFESANLEEIEEDLVATSVDSPLLSMFRERLNEDIPTLTIPPEAITLDGSFAPANLRLFAIRVDGSGLGLQDYFGLAAKVVPSR